MQTVTLLATVPAILAIVNFLKGQGLKSNLAIVAAVVLGVVLNVADYYLASSGAYQAAAQGLILGLGAAGLYDVTKQPEAISAAWENYLAKDTK
jgi:hypothetical protein